MKWRVVQYKTKPEKAEQNALLIKEVFKELNKTGPCGLHYLALRIDDNTFVHVLAIEDGAKALTDFQSFKAFQNGIPDRYVQPPEFHDATAVGSHEMLQGELFTDGSTHGK